MVTPDMRKRLEERYGRKPVDPTLVFKCAIGLCAIAVVSVIGTNSDTLTQTVEAAPALGQTIGAPLSVSMTHQRVNEPGSAAFKGQSRLPGWKGDTASGRPLAVNAIRCADDRSSAHACLKR